MPVPARNPARSPASPSRMPSALAAMNETPVMVKLPEFTWPEGLSPTASQFSNHAPGQPITTAVGESVRLADPLYRPRNQRATESFQWRLVLDAGAQENLERDGHKLCVYQPQIQELMKTMPESRILRLPLADDDRRKESRAVQNRASPENPTDCIFCSFP